MDIKIKGNPGTGNTFMEINIHHVDNLYTTAPVPSDNKDGTHAGRQGAAAQAAPPEDTALLRREILDYVSRLCTYLADGWKSSYRRTWEDILDIGVVSAAVYNPGKQQKTNFNRTLVANIIHYLQGKGAYAGNYNAALFALILEGSKDHPVRGALGKDPDAGIVSRLNRHFEPQGAGC